MLIYQYVDKQLYKEMKLSQIKTKFDLKLMNLRQLVSANKCINKRKQ